MKLPEFDGADRTSYRPYRRKFEAYVATYGERVGVELQSVRGRGAALERKLAASEEAAKKAARSLPSVSAVEDEAAAAEMRARYWEAEAKKKKKMIQSR